MRNTKVGIYQDDHIALLKSDAAGRRGIKAEGLFVGHALKASGVAVQKAHAEFNRTAEECYTLEGDLTGRKEGC